MRVKRTLPWRRVPRGHRPRVMTCIETRPVPLCLTSKALGPIMNVELKNMQAIRREKIAAGLIKSEG